MSVQMPLFGHCQRWRNRRESYRPAGEPINPSHYEVVRLSDADARDFVVVHHYSGSYPAARARYGLLYKPPFGRELLAGCSVFAVPMNNHVVPKYLGVAPNSGVELSRFVLLDGECAPANAETFFISRAIRLLAEDKPEVRGIVSYADPLPRHRADGSTYKPGHIGTCYQSANAVYLGLSGGRTLTLARDGTVVSERSLSKIRLEESGQDYAVRQLIALGAPPPRLDESAGLYVARAIQEGGFRKIRHPGNHVYVWPTGSATQRRGLRKRVGPGFRYPKPTGHELDRGPAIPSRQ